jgi:uncharacterized membrane protein
MKFSERETTILWTDFVGWKMKVRKRVESGEKNGLPESCAFSQKFVSYFSSFQQIAVGISIVHRTSTDDDVSGAHSFVYRKH